MAITHGKYPQMLSKQAQLSRSPLRLCESTGSLAIRLCRASQATSDEPHKLQF